MIVPSIDLMGGKVVQLEQGERKRLERDDPEELASSFALYGEINVIDLDRAKGEGENDAIVRSLVSRFAANVGGGVRTPERARDLLRAGARRVIVGSAAFQDEGPNFPFLDALRRAVHPERVVIALDSRGGKVATHGWRHVTSVDARAAAAALEPYCGAFLYTAVDREGLLGGTDQDAVRALAGATSRPLYVAGGIADVEEMRWVLDLGASPVLGMAIYTGKIKLDEALVQLVDWEKVNGLAPTVVRDRAGRVLMHAHSTRASLARALALRRGIYWSRSRREVWVKGETSGNVQRLVAARLDCDRDALLFVVEQEGRACHLPRQSCFDDAREEVLLGLARRIEERRRSPRAGGYTDALLANAPRAREKVVEEAVELALARAPADVAWEAADVLYHVLVLLAERGVPLERVLDELRGRERI